MTLSHIFLQDSYWVANGFIWDWLLLPALPLAEVLKQDVATSSSGSGPIPQWEKISAYLVLAFSIVGIWAATLPAWPLFIVNVLRAKNSDLVFDLLAHLVNLITN